MPGCSTRRSPGLRAWKHAGHELAVSVNVSPHQLRRPGFVSTVAAALARSGVDPPLLRLEITESALLDSDVVAVVMPALRELGVRVALDDFGTGYSSLSYLQTLTVDTLKIDKSFLTPIRAGQHAPLIAAIVAMAHNLDLAVVAEGVETPEQLALLRSLGCDRAQGFLFARPLAPDDLLALIIDLSARPDRILGEAATDPFFVEV